MATGWTLSQRCVFRHRHTQKMNLPLWLSACIIISSYGIVRAAEFKRLSHQENDRNEIRTHLTITRWSRSLHGIGNAVVRALMKGTKEVPTKSPNHRKFLKQGTEHDAISDFNSMNPVDVNTRSYGADGLVGDTKFRLKLRDSRNSKLPTILISDPEMAKQIKIVYINNPTLRLFTNPI